jgi:membrane-associated protein
MLESIVNLVSDSPWTYAVLLAVAAFDALVPLVPSETAVISAGVLAAGGHLELWLIIPAAAVGAYTGDTSAYLLGRRFGHRLDRLVFRGEKGVRRRFWAQRGLDRHGGPLIFGARFVPGGRTATTVTSGVLRMRWARFALFASAAGLVWATYAALVGFVGGSAFEDNPLWGLLLGFGIAGGTFFAVELGRRARKPSDGSSSPRRRPPVGGDPGRAPVAARRPCADGTE